MRVYKAAPAAIVFLLGVGQSVSGWEDPRIGAGLIAFGVLLGVYWLVASRARAGQPPQEPQGDTAAINVSSEGQSGGITAGVVHFSAPQPGVSGEVQFVNRPTADGYVSRVLITITAPYAAEGLEVSVTGKSITRFELAEPGPMTRMSRVRRDTSPTLARWAIGTPLSGTYVATVYTELPDAPDVTAVLH